MVTIERLVELGEAVLENCPLVKSFELVSTESELKDRIGKVRSWPLMVIVIPNATGNDENHDNCSEINNGLFYVLDRMKENMNTQQRLDLWSSTQAAMKEFKTYIHDQICGDFEDLFHFHDFEKRSIEPEYNLVDCSGWSLQFNFVTEGF